MPVQYLSKSPSLAKSFIDRFDTFLFDCDGVLWSGSTPFAGVVDTLTMLRAQGKRLVFVTNNSTKSRAQYAKKLNGMGIPATVDDIACSALSAAVYIDLHRNADPTKQKVFVLGEAGIEEELRLAGIDYLGGTDVSLARAITDDDYRTIGDRTALDPGVGTVLVGFDTHVSYLKYSTAVAYVQMGARLIATNPDSTFPTNGVLFPGAGSVSAPVLTALGLTINDIPVMGKPERPMMDAVDRVVGGLDRSRACMVGDRLQTDIQFGVDHGLGGTLAVLTGVATEAEVLAWESGPDAYLDKLSDLLIIQQDQPSA